MFSSVQPLVSIIVPAYNAEKYLRASLDSILSQTYRNSEITVWDDASTDTTPAILNSYADSVRVIRQPGNRGIYDNVNDGIAMAKGEFIAIYHADDIYMPTMVEREVEFLVKYPRAGAVFTNMTFMGPDSEDLGRLELPEELPKACPLDYGAVLNGLLQHKNHFLMCPTAMVRAAAYREVGVYRQNLFFDSSDLDMWVRIARKYPVGLLEERLLRYRHFHNSSSLRYQKLRTEEDLHFRIVDLCLDDGGRSLATPEALAAHEAHRAEDLMIAATSNYIMDRREDAARLLSRVRAKRILGSPRIQRGRMLLLFAMLHVLVRLPRIGLVAHAFRRRFHEKGPSKTKK